MSIIIKDLSYIHSDKEILFQHLHLSIQPGDKIALIGNNGCGKSTLMRIISGELQPTSGNVSHIDSLCYVPQHFGQYDHCTIAQVLRMDQKIEALHSILKGNVTEQNLALLDDDWNIEENIEVALSAWGIDNIPVSHPFGILSGGEKTRIFLAGMELHSPSVILLDEPTNHLDTNGRQRLYKYIRRSSATILVISHDRTLLNQLSSICEMSPNGLTHYGGNYEFFKEQKSIHQNALQLQLEEKQKAIRLAQKTAREVAERKNKHDVRGEKTNLKKGVPRIVLHSLKSKAENSTTKLINAHTDKTEKLQQEIRTLRNLLPLTEKLKTNFNTSDLHLGKVLVTAKDVNFCYPNASGNIWNTPLNFQIRSGERFCIEGNNGSGKTTLLKLISGELLPTEGIIDRTDFSLIYLDQEYSIIKNQRSILEQAEHFNRRLLPEHELKTILNRYLFPSTIWGKPCGKLSGGEKMRLSFCCLMIADNTPDVFILDEPTNNLDIESTEIITATIREYTGTILAVSHDREFLKEIKSQSLLLY